MRWFLRYPLHKALQSIKDLKVLKVTKPPRVLKPPTATKPLHLLHIATTKADTGVKTLAMRLRNNLKTPSHLAPTTLVKLLQAAWLVSPTVWPREMLEKVVLKP